MSRPDNLPALILAAGRGERMRPLTDTCPKPLLSVRGQRLIEWHLAALARDGVRDVVINTAHLEDQFEPILGDGRRWGLRIRYAFEQRDHGGALETAGGIANALPLLNTGGAGSDAFWVVAGDVFVPGFRFDAEVAQAFVHDPAWRHDLGHLWLVPNPAHVPHGDFALTREGRILLKDQAPAGTPTYTYSTIGLYRPGMVEGIAPGQKAALRPCFDRAIAAGRLGGRVHAGEWADVGTPQRLAALNEDTGGPR